MKSRKKEGKKKKKRREMLVDRGDRNSKCMIISVMPSREHIYGKNVDQMSKISEKLCCEREELARYVTVVTTKWF